MCVCVCSGGLRTTLCALVARAYYNLLVATSRFFPALSLLLDDTSAVHHVRVADKYITQVGFLEALTRAAAKKSNYSHAVVDLIAAGGGRASGETMLEAWVAAGEELCFTENDPLSEKLPVFLALFLLTLEKCCKPYNGKFPLIKNIDALERTVEGCLVQQAEQKLAGQEDEGHDAAS